MNSGIGWVYVIVLALIASIITGVAAGLYLKEDYQPEIYAATKGETPPNLVMIQTLDGYPHGIGYLTIDGRIFTIGHLFNEDTQLISKTGSGQTLSFRCKTWLKPSGASDGTCLTELNSGLAGDFFDPATRQIVRARTQDLEFDQVAVWNFVDGHWMIFRILERGINRYLAVGQGLDFDQDGQLDVLSRLCQGYSGSPVFISKNGRPIADSFGNLVAVGEVDAIYNFQPAYMAGGKKACDTMISFAIQTPD